MKFNAKYLRKADSKYAFIHQLLDEASTDGKPLYNWQTEENIPVENISPFANEVEKEFNGRTVLVDISTDSKIHYIEWREGFAAIASNSLVSGEYTTVGTTNEDQIE